MITFMRLTVLLSFLFLYNSGAMTYAQGKTDIQGHRGCRGLMPENTLEAFIYAIDIGVHTLEMDVVISSDMEVIVSHEPYFNHEISTGPDGSEITKDNELQYNIYRMNVDEIKNFDVGIKVHPRFPNQKKINCHKPLLSEVITKSDLHTGEIGSPAILYNIEIKRQKEYDHIYHPDPATFASLVYRVINSHGIKDRTTIQSFDVESLQAIKKTDASVSQALLVDIKENYKEKLDKLGYLPEILSPHFFLVNDEMIRFCKTKGMKLIPWTVNEIKHIERMLEMGVDGIISDYPDRVIQIIQQKYPNK
jgi:glycerophosphoryl diester phosphodiesterase